MPQYDEFLLTTAKCLSVSFAIVFCITRMFGYFVYSSPPRVFADNDGRGDFVILPFPLLQ